MTIIRLTKEFGFEMAHALDNYDGACSQLHGHSYGLFVTVKGSPKQDDTDPKNGMVMDFRTLKQIVKENIVDRYDHSLVIMDSGPNRAVVEALRARFERIILTDYQPTCENMIGRFAQIISSQLPEGVELYSLRMHETATSYAEWYADDNKK